VQRPRPYRLQKAHFTPLLKKPHLEVGDLSNYRPVSNLSVLSKLLERAVCAQLVSFLDQNDLPWHQSAYRRFHSTDTAFTVVFSNILTALDSGQLTLLSLLDLSAAFDCVDHDILLKSLNSKHSIWIHIDSARLVDIISS
jgi:hypothetical protein